MRSLYYFTLFIAIAFPSMVNATEYWSMKVTGIITRSDGNVAINIGTNQPTNPYPSGATWVACVGNWIFFHRDENWISVGDQEINRIMSVALTAYQSNHDVRVGMNRDSGGTCFLTSLHDYKS